MTAPFNSNGKRVGVKRGLTPVKVKTDKEVLEHLHEKYTTAKQDWLRWLHRVQRICTHENIVEATRYADKTHRMCLDCKMREFTGGVVFHFLLWKKPEGPVPYSAPPQVPIDWLLNSSAGFIHDAGNAKPKREKPQAELVDEYFVMNFGFPKENET